MSLGKIYFLSLIFTAAVFLGPLYAIKICEEQDLYDLTDPTCVLEYQKKSKTGQVDAKEVMFDIMKTYPYENKGKFEGFLERKIELIESSVAQLKNDPLTEKSKNEIVQLEEAGRILAEHLVKVRLATQENWEETRDQARSALNLASEALEKAE